MTTSQLHELLQRSLDEVAGAIQHIGGMSQLSLEITDETAARTVGLATLLSALGNILVTKGIVTPEELDNTISQAEAVIALQIFVDHLAPKEEETEEKQDPSGFPEDARIFGE